MEVKAKAQLPDSVSITDISTDGRDVFLSWLLKKDGDAFKADVVDPILKEEEKK